MTLNGRFMKAPAVAAALLIVYWPIAYLIEDGFQAELLRAVQGTAMFLIFLGFLLKFRQAYEDDIPDSARRFYLGLILWSLGAAYGADWRLLWRLFGGGPDVDWMLTQDFVQFQIWVEIVGIFFMLSGPTSPSTKFGDTEATTPRDISWSRICMSATACAGVAWLFVVERVGVEPLRKIVDLLKPAGG